MVEDQALDLRHFQILKDLPDEVLTEIHNGCRWRREPAGKVIFASEDPSDGVYFVATGKVSIVLDSASGDRVIFSIFGPHEMFGEVSAIDGEPRSASVEVVEDCLLGVLSLAQFNRLASTHPSFAFAVMRQLTAQVRRLTARVYEFSTLGVQGRVYAELLRLAELSGISNNQALLSPAPLLVVIAASISTHREAVSRIISRLQDKEIVRREGSDPRSLRIIDVEGLRELVREAKGE
jgi:CRP-like cAMP-binding protein